MLDTLAKTSRMPVKELKAVRAPFTFKVRTFDEAVEEKKPMIDKDLTVAGKLAGPLTRVFFDVRYQGAIDTEPFQRDPLGGVPPTAMLGNNALFRVGVELPLSPRSSVVFGLNLDAHFRTEDSVMMPGLQVGIVTAL